MSNRNRTDRRLGESNETGEPLAAPAIMLLASLIKRSANVEYRQELGLSSITWKLIAWLGGDGPMTQAEIVEKYLIDRGQLSRAAVSLSRDGVILRKRKTWRSIELSLAPKGDQIWKEILCISRARQKELVRGMSKRNLKILFQVLDTISVNASEMLNTALVRDDEQNDFLLAALK